MQDTISKRKGVPFSTSRSQERKNKHRTHKARRQDGRKAIVAWDQPDNEPRRFGRDIGRHYAALSRYGT